MHMAYSSTTDIQGRSQTPYTVPCNGVISHGAQIGGLWGFADHTQKKCKTKCVHDFRVAFCVCLSSRLDCSRCRWHTHLTHHSYFYYGKNPKTLNLSPHWGKNGAGSGISLVYLWVLHRFKQFGSLKCSMSLSWTQHCMCPHSLTCNKQVKIWY